MANCAFCGSSSRVIGRPCPRCGKLNEAEQKLLLVAIKNGVKSKEHADELRAAYDSLMAGVSTLQADVRQHVTAMEETLALLKKTPGDSGGAEIEKTVKVVGNLRGALETVQKAQERFVELLK